MPPTSDPERMLRGAALRVTRPRVAALSVVHDHPHADTDTIIRGVRGTLGDNHHHVVCRACGAIEDVDCAVGAAPCLTSSDDRGFAIDEAEVTYWALCPECAFADTRRPHGQGTMAVEAD